MKGTFVREINKNSRVDGIFLVKEKHVGVTKNGTPYLSLKLMDRTGEINSRVWDEAEGYDRMFDKSDFIMVSGRSSLYQGGMQLTISDLKKCNPQEVDLADFLPACPLPAEEMLKELRLMIEDIRDEFLKKLLTAFFEDQDFVQRFKTAPAAKALHHVYLGGLLEHSLSVARLGRLVLENYDGINRDLVITGALLHDIGKIQELSYDNAFDYTDTGRLLGHITMGVEMIDEKMAAIADFPPKLSMLVRHMILSHHGAYEYGSPKRPKTLEALILYYLDDLDAKVNGFQQIIVQDPNVESKWSGYHKLFDRYVFKEGYQSNEFLPPRMEEPEGPAIDEE